MAEIIKKHKLENMQKQQQRYNSCLSLTAYMEDIVKN